MALLFENRPEFFFHYLALNALGCGVVPVNPDYRHDELAYLLEHSEAATAASSAALAADARRPSRACGAPVARGAVAVAVPSRARRPPPEAAAKERAKPLPVLDAA